MEVSSRLSLTKSGGWTVVGMGHEGTESQEVDKRDEEKNGDVGQKLSHYENITPSLGP